MIIAWIGKDLVGFTNVVLFNTREGESNIGAYQSSFSNILMTDLPQLYLLQIITNNDEKL